MKLGYRAIIVTGQPEDPEKRYALDVTADEVRVIPADEHKASWNYALIEELIKTYSKTASFISIGPAGELKLAGGLGRLHGSLAGSPPGASRGTGRPRRGDGKQGPQVHGHRRGKATHSQARIAQGVRRALQEVYEGVHRGPRPGALFRSGARA